jgi:hypothetical protein
MRPYFTRACLAHKCLCIFVGSGLASPDSFSRLAFKACDAGCFAQMVHARRRGKLPKMPVTALP